MNNFFSSILLTASMGLVALSAEAQVSNLGNNKVTIPDHAQPTDVIRIAANVTPSKAQFRWQQLEITAFFHFGINTFTDREWGEGTESEKLFNPSSLDVDQWVRVAKESGIKQVIITAKHHDGFCLWPSKYTEHSVKNSPWKDGKGDVVKDLSVACKKYKIGFGVYLSPWDRNNKSYGDSPKYNQYFVDQLTELLTNYGKVDEVWFDGACGEGPNGKRQEYDWETYYKVIRKLQPEAVIAISGPDVRWVGTESGYGRESEWSVVPQSFRNADKVAAESQKTAEQAPLGDMVKSDLGSREKIKNAQSLIWYPAETDVSIRPGWFYHAKEDNQVKSPQKLLDIYYSSVGRNSVLLLNIPPDRRGMIHENDIRNMKEWRSLIDRTFVVNYLKGAKVIAHNGTSPKLMFDGNCSSAWTTNNETPNAVIELQLKKPAMVNVLSLQENITVGQRIEKFMLEYWNGNAWQKLTEGTTVGYKRLLKFEPTEVSKVRLTILESRLNPTIAEFGLYAEPQK